MSILSFNSLGFSTIPINPLLPQPNLLIGNLLISSLKQVISINTLFHQLVRISPEEQLNRITLEQFLCSISSTKKLTNEIISMIFNVDQVMVHADLLIRYYSVVNLNIELISKKLANQPINPIVKPTSIDLSPTISVDAYSSTDVSSNTDTSSNIDESKDVPVDNHEGVDAEEDISRYFC